MNLPISYANFPEANPLYPSFPAHINDDSSQFLVCVDTLGQLRCPTKSVTGKPVHHNGEVRSHDTGLILGDLLLVLILPDIGRPKNKTMRKLD